MHRTGGEAVAAETLHRNRPGRPAVAWETVASWAAGYRLLEARRGKVGPEKWDRDLFRHVAALAAELDLIAVAPLDDLEWVLDIMRDAPGPRVPIIDALDRRRTQLRRLHGDDGSRVYTVEAPEGHQSATRHWRVYRKGGVGLVHVRVDIAAQRLAPLMAGRGTIQVRGWARGTGYTLDRNALLSEFVGTIKKRPSFSRGVARAAAV